MIAPTYLYKLVGESTPPIATIVDDAFPEALPVSELDAQSGFVHLSTAAQVPGTLRFFFKGHPRVCVLRIPYAAVRADIRWEAPQPAVCGPRTGEGEFPHLYNDGPRLGRAEVEGVRVWEAHAGPGEDADADEWGTALAAAGDWLVD